MSTSPTPKVRIPPVIIPVLVSDDISIIFMSNSPGFKFFNRSLFCYCHKVIKLYLKTIKTNVLYFVYKKKSRGFYRQKKYAGGVIGLLYAN